MASLADLSGIFTPSTPSGFNLARTNVRDATARAQADLGRSRILRNFSQFDLPDLLSSQAARGAFQSTATDRKKMRLTTGASDSLADIQLGLFGNRINLASNALLGQTGIQL